MSLGAFGILFQVEDILRGRTTCGGAGVDDDDDDVVMVVLIIAYVYDV